MAHNTVFNPGEGGDTGNSYDLAAGGAYSTTGKVASLTIFVSPNSTTAPTPVTPANPLPVSVTDTVAVTGTFFQTTQPVSAASLPLPTGAATDATISTLSGKVTACNTGAVVVSTLPSLPAGSNTVGSVSLVPATSGGLTPYSLASAATINATVVKASAGQVYGYGLYNTTSSAKFVRIYDKATTPVPSSDTPVRRIMLPANGGSERAILNGIQFTSGIAFVITGAAGDTDTTTVSVNDVFVNIDYK